VIEIISNNNSLSLHWNLATPSLFQQKKRKKRREMKFGTEIKFLMIRGTNYLRAKKYGGLK